MKGVSRRREKKRRLRRDARAGLSRGNQRDPAIPLLFSLHRDDVGASRRREKKGRLRRDDRVLCVLCVLCALCANPFFDLWNE